eukprot:g63347.t1
MTQSFPLLLRIGSSQSHYPSNLPFPFYSKMLIPYSIQYYCTAGIMSGIQVFSSLRSIFSLDLKHYSFPCS